MATAVAHKYGEAHCIVTGGIVGGSGDGRRRGFDSCIDESPRVFVGPHSSHAALQLIATNNSTNSSSTNTNSGTATVVAPGSTVQWVPVGQPASLEQLTHEWPDSATWSRPTNDTDSDYDDTGMMDDSTNSGKRVVSDGENSAWFRGSSAGTTAEKEHRMMMDSSTTTPPRPAKRACRPTTANHAAFLNQIAIVQGGMASSTSSSQNGGSSMEH